MLLCLNQTCEPPHVPAKHYFLSSIFVITDDLTSISTISRIQERNKRFLSFNGPSLSDAFVKMQKILFVPVILQGTDKLWKEHISFTDAHKKFTQGPLLGAAKGLHHYVQFDVVAALQSFEDVVKPIAAHILSIDESSIAAEDDTGGDKEVVEQVLELFVECIYKEVCIEAGTNNKVVGGKIDFVGGITANGNRPKLCIDNQVSIYLVSMMEAKKKGEHLAQSAPNEKSTDIKTTLQPILETTVLAQKCDCPHSEVPLINIYANRYFFRPYLYFKHHDVMLTTLGVVPYRTEESIHTIGLQLLHFLFSIHMYPFAADVLNTLEKTRWSSTLPSNAYGPESKVTLQHVYTNTAHSSINEPLMEGSQQRKRKSSDTTCGIPAKRVPSS